jgi:putative copper export protein
MQAEPLIHWPDPIKEYIGFVAQFLSTGAVGFRYAAVRDRLVAPRGVGGDEDGEFYVRATQRAAALGLVGALVQAVLLALDLPRLAARAHGTVAHLLATRVPTGASVILLAVAIVGLALAASGRRAGWPLALAGLILGPLTGILAGQWSRLANPVHRLVAALWLGTLLVLVVAGLAVLLRDERARARRGRIAADMVNDFSPLALTCGMILVLSGLVTAWNHLNPLSSLWTTPYGYALLVKLALVAVVFGLGAWNWRRQRPTLGTEDAATSIRRSSTAELTAAALVLAATAVLISLPAPRPPRPAGAAAGAAQPGGPPPGAPSP